MGDSSKIEWTDATWNPLVGCKAVSPGCDHCYAAALTSGRLAHLPAYAGLAKNGVFTGEVRCLPERLDQPLRWKRPRRIFVNSMSDLFHHDIPLNFQVQVFDTMERTPRHTFQVLTKRPEIMRRRVALIYQELGFTRPADHIWLGTSIESDEYVRRADHLRLIPCVRFLSLEPLLGPLPSLDLTGIDWVIVGGESGPGARPMHGEWVRDIRDQCIENRVPFLFKQWGEWAPDLAFNAFTGAYLGEFGDESMTRIGKHAAGRELDGRTWDEYPDV